MNSRKRKALRGLGKVLFVLYIGFLIYFLIFSDWYGRTGEMQEYHYNLVLFKEIKRFWQYQMCIRDSFVTVNPYLGSDGVNPFIDVCKEEKKGLFILVKTSNPDVYKRQI